MSRFRILYTTGFSLGRVGLKACFSLALLLSAACGWASAPGTLPDPILDRSSSADMVPNEIIVKIREAPGSLDSLPAQDLVSLGIDPNPVRRTSGGEVIYRLTQEASSGLGSDEEKRARLLEIVQQLGARPEVEYAQPDWPMQPFSP